VAAALADLTLLDSGKVREIYGFGPARPDRLLLVASDRVSTYDAVHPTPIPGKGEVLTGLSAFWFERFADIVPHHVISTRSAAARWSSPSSACCRWKRSSAAI
jgi:phosphoribosylaminoimidazole-succinocarboxamide synthase